MDSSLLATVTLLAALGAGVIAGLFFVFSVAIMRALARIPPAAGIAAMQSINIVILNPIFGLVFFGTAAACVVIGAAAIVADAGPGSAYLIAGCVFYLLGAIGVTLICNVPRNNALAKLDPSSAEAGRAWARYLSEWTAWNHVRTLASLASSGCLTIGYCLLRDGGAG